MALDRDIGVSLFLGLRREGKSPSRGWEMLAATGVRGLRLLHEAKSPDVLFMSESSPAAIDVLRENAARVDGSAAHVLFHDARWPLPSGPFDYVDLDPFGTPMPYLPSALDAADSGTLLGVTATDMAVFAGVARGMCAIRYGARPVRGYAAGEGALRILLGAIDRAAEARGLALRPILSYVGDHHVRAYLRILRRTGDTQVGEIDIRQWTGAPLPGSGSVGPLWLGPMFDTGVLEQLEPPPSAAEPAALQRFLSILREESNVDVPFFYEPNRLAHDLRLAQPPALGALISALKAMGGRAARSHVRAAAFRTDVERADVERVAFEVATAAQSQNARVRA